ncbi:MAG: zinc-ribbon domain-containing protein [Myxococcales bacterium]
MQISCERCSTVYVLDDKLIPPGGAPVQCTRCGLVFTAKPPPGAVAAAPAPKPTAPPKPMPRMPTPHAAAAAAPADDRRSTMMFGAQGAAAPPPAAAPHSTMMFGGAAPTPAPAPAPRAPAPSASPHATMMFGGAGAAGPVPTPAPAAAPAPMAGNPSSTMMFGAVGGPAAAPSGSHATQMFGGVGPQAANPQASPDQGATLLFARSPFEGPPAPSSPPADAAGSASTMMFGKSPFADKAPAAAPAAAPAPAPNAASSTMMFGESPFAAKTPAPVPTPTPAPRANNTMMFGAASEVPRPDGPPPAAIPPSASSTMMFGSVGSAGAAPQQTDRTPPAPLRAAAKPAAKKPAPEPEPFQPEAETVSGGPEHLEEGAGDVGVTDPSLAPLPPQQPAAQAPAWMAPQAETAEAPRTKRGRPAPAPAPAPVPMPQPPRAPPQPLVGSSTMELQLSLKKRQRKVPVILGVLVLLIFVTVAAIMFLKMRTPPADPALVAADGKAWELLKRDDAKSIEQAIQQWDQLLAKAPEFVPARANLMVAHVLMNQDLRDETRRLLAQYQQLSKDLTKLEEKKEPADWRTKANALREEMIRIKAVYEPLQQEAAKHDEKSGELLKSSKALVEKLGAAGDGTSVFRASALYYASKGQDATEKLAEFYRKNPDDRNVLHDDARAFADLAVAGRYAQQRVTPADRDKAKLAADAALQKDPKLLRAYLFLGKVYFASKEYDLANAELDKLLKLNPEHDVAQKLKAEIAEAVAAAKKAEEKAAQRAAEEKAAEEKAANEKAANK